MNRGGGIAELIESVLLSVVLVLSAGLKNFRLIFCGDGALAASL